MPALAREHSKAGAAAFGRFVLELTDESFVRSDAAQLRSISNAGCRGCEFFASDVEERARAGKHNRERSLRVIKAAWVEKYKGRDTVDVLIKTYPVDIVDSAGERVDVQTGGRQGAFRLEVTWRGDRWSVSQFNALVQKR